MRSEKWEVGSGKWEVGSERGALLDHEKHEKHERHKNRRAAVGGHEAAYGGEPRRGPQIQILTAHTVSRHEELGWQAGTVRVGRTVSDAGSCAEVTFGCDRPEDDWGESRNFWCCMDDGCRILTHRGWSMICFSDDPSAGRVAVCAVSASAFLWLFPALRLRRGGWNHGNIA